MARFNIVTNLTNQAGLEREYKFTRALLESYGHTVNGVQFNDLQAPLPNADVNIFIEVVAEHAFKAAPVHWLVPHSEWWYDQPWNQFLPRFSKVICKTEDCFRIWQRKTPGKCVYTGFESLDLYRPDIKKETVFLHAPGKSSTRQTDVVAAAWREYKLPYQLTVVTALTDVINVCRNVPNLTLFPRISDDSLIDLMNRCQFIITTPKYEGFGHVMHEAIGCGAVVLATNAPPMNQFHGIDREMLVPVSKSMPWRAATANLIAPQHLAATVKRASELTPARIAEISASARQAFLDDRDSFRAKFRELMACV